MIKTCITNKIFCTVLETVILVRLVKKLPALYKTPGSPQTVTFIISRDRQIQFEVINLLISQFITYLATQYVKYSDNQLVYYSISHLVT